jgi:predicted phage terminase large subunit-like protein
MNPLSPVEYRALLRNDFMSFIERSFYELNPERSFIHAPFIELIAANLEACRSGQLRRLAINLPPRSLKSHCASIAFSAWLLGHNPAAHVICASYGQDLADKFARDCRIVMNTMWYKGLFSTRLSDRQAVGDFRTTLKGSRLSTSVGGVLTGRGADFIVIDDPLKPDDALSQTRREAVNDWYDNTLLSRLNDKSKGCIIIIMQRLHQDDLIGHVSEQDDWKVLSFPAIAVENEAQLVEDALGRRWYRRRGGEALHPEREPLEALAKTRQAIGEYNFLSQYQQEPAPIGGAMVKTAWLAYYDSRERPEKFNRIVQSWDTANKANELSDYSVCTTWGIEQKCYYLLDVYRRRLEYPDLRRAVTAQARLHNANNILIEDKASGTQLIQDLKYDQTWGVTAYEPPSGMDKVMRLHSQTPAFENSFVRLPRSAPWLADYVAELTGFPGTKYDDQVDSTTQFLDYIQVDRGLEIWIKLGQMK